MKRLFQTLLAAIGVLGVVVVAAVVYVTTFLDPEDFKPRLIEVVEEHSGLELSMDGPLAWSFYPRLGVSVESVESRLPEQGDEAPFLAFERAEVSLAFAPLLRREIAIEGLTLDGMQLRLERDEQGRGNWEPLLQRLDERREGAESALAPASAGPSFAGGGNLAVALNIASVQVRNGEVLFRDLGEQREWLLEGLSLSGTNVNPARAFPLRTAFRVASYGALDWRELERPPGFSSEVSLESRVHLDLAERRYRLEGLKLNTATRLADVEGQQTLNLSGRELLLELSQRRMRLDDGVLDASLQHPELGEQAVALSLAFMLDADLAEHTAQLRKLQLSGPDNLRLSGNLNLAGLDAAPTYSGQLSLAPLSLRPWLTRMDRLPVTAGPDALSDVAMTSPVRGDLSRLELSSLTLVLDDSTFTGRLAVGFAGDDLSVDLRGDRLDLDAYLPPPQEAADTASRGGFFAISRAHADDEAPLVPAEWLSALRLDASLVLGQLRLMGLEFAEVELGLAGSDGRQRLEGFTSGLYDGELSASGELDLTRDPVRWQLAPTLSRVRLEPLIQALARSEEPAPMRGRLTVDGQLESRGNSWPMLRRNLDGRLATHIDEGAVLDVNVSRELCTTVAALEGRETTRDWSADTRFERAEANVRINDGVARSDDILLTLPGIELGGEGELDLVTERFDLRAAARFVDSADAACRVNPRLERVPMPVRCSGSYLGDSHEWCRFDREAFQASLVELLRDEAARRGQDEIERRLERPLEQLDERLGEGAGQELREALRGLFN